MADAYYIDSRATGANNGSKNDGTLDADGVVDDAWQSIADISGILANDAPDIYFGEGSGSYFAVADFFAGNGIKWRGNGCEITASIDCNDSAYKWTASSTSGEYYLELSGGGDPSLVEAKAGTVDSYFCMESAEASRTRGTPGSLSFDKQFGWGDADTLGYSTLYVRLTVDPSTVEVRVAQHDGFYEGWNANKLYDIVFSYSNDYNVRAYEDWEYYRCVFKYANNSAVTIPGQRNNVVVDSCNGYWSGHRFIWMEGVNCDAVVTNCIGFEPHLFAACSSGCDGTTALTIRNCILVNGEAGAIDWKSATAVLTEDHNCWYPRMTATNGALGYISQANWATTDATDIPDSHATSESTQSNLTDPGFTISDDGYVASEFELARDSVCIDAGIDLSGAGANRVGISGEPFSDFDTSMGSSQSTNTPFHPSKL